MTADLHNLGRKMRGVIVALQSAVDDVERGHYGAEDRERLAGYLDNSPQSRWRAAGRRG